jgi:hypothetical protein
MGVQGHKSSIALILATKHRAKYVNFIPQLSTILRAPGHSKIQQALLCLTPANPWALVRLVPKKPRALDHLNKQSLDPEACYSCVLPPTNPWDLGRLVPKKPWALDHLTKQSLDFKVCYSDNGPLIFFSRQSMNP